MLDHTGRKVVKFLRHLLKGFVVVAYLDLFGPEDVAVDAGDGKAALGVGYLLRALFQDFRVDEGAAEVFQIGVCVGNHVTVHDDDALAYTDLGGCKAAAIGPHKGVLEVLDQGGDAVFV